MSSYGAVLAGLMLVLIVIFAANKRESYLLWLPITAVGTAVIIFYLASGGGGPFRRLLEFSPLVWTGRISYGLYLWHFPIFMLMSYWGVIPWAVLFGGGALTFAMAAASYYLLERRLLALGRPSVPTDKVEVESRRLSSQPLVDPLYTVSEHLPSITNA